MTGEMQTGIIQYAFFDIDGVLTDGRVYIDSEGKESKKMSFVDIDAIYRLKRAGIKIGFITGEKGAFPDYVRNRFEPDYFADGCKDKLGYFKKLEESGQVDPVRACFVGDSDKDVELLKYLSHSFAPSDCFQHVRDAAAHVVSSGRGNGVIHDVAEYILRVENAVKQPRRAKTVSGDTLFETRLAEHQEVVAALQNPEFISGLKDAAKALVAAFKKGKKLFICGNGGSAADSQHLATEFVGRFLLERKALPAEALSVNTSSLTAIGNDYGFDRIFARQLEAKGAKGDTLLAISTSGNSNNIIEVLRTARRMGLITIGLTGGNTRGGMQELCDHCIAVPSVSTPRIQEAHILVGHMLCEAIENALFGAVKEP